MSQGRLVDVAFLGWPKCGTSSLFRWIDAHPEVTGSRPKETNFFFDAHHPLCGRQGASFLADGPDAYARFFPQQQGRLRLDGSVHTFCQITAMEEFGRWEEPPFVVAVLRNPADRIYSSFRYTQGDLGAIDRNLSFSSYAEALLSGRSEDIVRNSPCGVSLWVAMRELELSQYVEWLDRWQSTVGRQHLVILLSEELKVSPLAMLRGLCERLGVDPTFYDDYIFEITNETRRPRSKIVHRLARRFGSRLPVSRTKSVLKGAYDRVQMDPTRQEGGEEDKQALKRLDKHFEPWNRQLAERFGLDLGSWRVER